MIYNTNANVDTKAMANTATDAYKNKLAKDTQTLTEILDLEFRRYSYPIKIDWILKMAEYLKQYKILTGNDYEIKPMEDTIV